MINAIVITKKHYIKGLEEIKDSMQLENGDIPFWLTCVYKDLKIDVDIHVYGDVRVIFKDKTYKCAGSMPKELLDCYKNGVDPATIATDRKYENPYFCDDNNWFEQVICVYDKNGFRIIEDCEVVDAPDDNSAEGWANAIIADVKEVLSNMEVEKLTSFDPVTVKGVFSDLFPIMRSGETMQDGASEDDVYSVAHDSFLKLAKKIETLVPQIAEDDTDDTKWYDEYHDDVVAEFCLALKS